MDEARHRAWLALAAMLDGGLPDAPALRRAAAYDALVRSALEAAGGEWKASRPALARLRGGDSPLRPAFARRLRLLGLSWAVVSGNAGDVTPEEAAHVVRALSGATSSLPFRGVRWPSGGPWMGNLSHVTLDGGAKSWRLVRATSAMGRIDEVDAPVAATLGTPDGEMPIRVHMGRALRPVLLPGGWLHCPSSLMPDLVAEPPAWADNPFVPDPMGPRGGLRGTTLLSPAEAVPEGRGSARLDVPLPALVDIGGVAYRACAFPVIDVATVIAQGTMTRPGWRMDDGFDSESVQGTLGLAPRRVEWVGDAPMGMLPTMPAILAGAFASVARAVAAVADRRHCRVAPADWERPPVRVVRADLLPDPGDPLPRHVSSVVLPAIRRAGTGGSDAACAALALARESVSPKAAVTWLLAHGACVAGDEAAHRAADDTDFAMSFTGA